MRRRFLAGLSGLICGCLACTPAVVHAQSVYYDAVDCPILDNPDRPAFEAGLTIVPEARFEDDMRRYGDGAVLEFDGMWALAHFWDVLMGEIDVGAQTELILFPDSAGVQLPDQLVQLNLDAGWTWRFQDGAGFQLRAMPGIYSDLEAVETRIVSMPVSAAFVQAFDPSLAGVLGLTYRHDFERRIMPIMGAVWQPSGALRVSAQIPESRVTWFGGRGWRVFGGFRWENVTYALREKGAFDRDDITLDDYRVYAGAEWRLNGNLRVSGRIGRIFNRTIEFTGGRGEPGDPQPDVDVDDALYLRLALVAPF